MVSVAVYTLRGSDGFGNLFATDGGKAPWAAAVHCFGRLYKPGSLSFDKLLLPARGSLWAQLHCCSWEAGTNRRSGRWPAHLPALF